MLRGAGFPLLENKKILLSKFQSFKVSQFQRFKDSKFQRFKILPKFQGFEISKISNSRSPICDGHTFLECSKDSNLKFPKTN